MCRQLSARFVWFRTADKLVNMGHLTDNPCSSARSKWVFVYSRKEVISLCAVVSPGAETAALKSCVLNRMDRGLCDRASRKAPCHHERCEHRFLRSFRTENL